MVIAVDLKKHDAATGEDKVVGRCRLDGASAVCEGPPALVEALGAGVVSYATGKVVKPDDGTDFLEALIDVYRDPHFYAVAAD